MHLVCLVHSWHTSKSTLHSHKQVQLKHQVQVHVHLYTQLSETHTAVTKLHLGITNYEKSEQSDMFDHNLKLKEHRYQTNGQVVDIYIASIVCTIYRQDQMNNCLRVCLLFSYRNKIIFTENIYIQVHSIRFMTISYLSVTYFYQFPLFNCSFILLKNVFCYNVLCQTSFPFDVFLAHLSRRLVSFSDRTLSFVISYSHFHLHLQNH